LLLLLTRTAVTLDIWKKRNAFAIDEIYCFEKREKKYNYICCGRTQKQKKRKRRKRTQKQKKRKKRNGRSEKIKIQKLFFKTAQRPRPAR
jgi:hypothetical protein